MGTYAPRIIERAQVKESRLRYVLEKLVNRFPLLRNSVGTGDVLGPSSSIRRRLRTAYRSSAPMPGRPLKVLHCIGSLGGGGAERQLSNLAVGTARSGMDVRVVTLAPVEGPSGHYSPLLQAGGVPHWQAGSRFEKSFDLALSRVGGAARLLLETNCVMKPATLELFGEILAFQPDIVHCWLDLTNICGGLSALLADVPAVILSTRSVNPTHFPAIFSPWFQSWYEALATSSRVQFLNNSQAGASDYSRWIGVPNAAFRVVRNGIDQQTFARAHPAEAMKFRRSLQIPEGAPVVAGIARMTEEKQPQIWVDAVCRAMHRNPALHGVLIGSGPLQPELQRAVDGAGFSGRFRLLPAQQEVAVVYAAADVFLLTSRMEGTPNVLLEAQARGCPVVATRTGGIPEAVLHGETGMLVSVGDVDGMTEAMETFLGNPRLREACRITGPRFVHRRFGFDRMVQDHEDLYDELLTGGVRSRESRARLVS